MEADNFCYELPRPYPDVSEAVGIYVCGDNALFAAGTWLRISKQEGKQPEKTAVEDELYNFVLVLCISDHDKKPLWPKARVRNGRILNFSPGAYADLVLDQLNLPKLTDFVTDTQEVRRQYYMEAMKLGQRYEITMVMSRELFEMMYRLMANSTFIQLGASPRMGYIMRDPPEDEKDEYLDNFYGAFPWETLEPEPVVPTMRPLVSYDLNVFGCVTYRPYSVMVFDGDQVTGRRLE